MATVMATSTVRVTRLKAQNPGSQAATGVFLGLQIVHFYKYAYTNCTYKGAPLDKPVDVFDRDVEWQDLADFVTSTLPGLRIAVVYGRRRQGKSYLLRRLAEAANGLYHLATEQGEALSLRRFGDALAQWQGLPVGALRFDGWEPALDTAIELMVKRGDRLLVLDEFPYLAAATPGLASIVQSLYDRIGPGSRHAPVRLILCGSAISVMSELLAGTKALRGRGALEARITPFSYRDARAFWGIDDLGIAFMHHALMGGTPGYRELVNQPSVPERPGRFGEWMARNVLRPSAPLFTEATRVIHEDPRIRDTATYSSVLAVIAAGETSATKIGGLLGRPATSLIHQINMLESAGFVERRQDLLLDRRPSFAVADPVMRLHHLVIEPYLADLEAGRATEVWQEAQHTVETRILGPHFESLAVEWVRTHARAEAGLEVGATGQSSVACRQHRVSHEIDVLSLARGVRPRASGAPIAFIGEAKARDRRPGPNELRHLEHLRDLLTAAGHDASTATLGLFSTNGFAEELVRESSGRPILLATLNDLYVG